MEQEKLIADGIHYLSGIGSVTEYDEWTINDVKLFCLDGKTYGAYVDRCDGYRSYGHIGEVDYKCQYTFPPQPVQVVNACVNDVIKHDGWTEYEDKFMIRILDATNGKEVLVVGTDNSDSFYPVAIFNYTPENLEINQNR